MRHRTLTLLAATLILAFSLLFADAPKALAYGPARSQWTDTTATRNTPCAGAKVQANVQYDMPGRGGWQTVHIYVQDVMGDGIASVPVKVQVHDRYHRTAKLAPITNSRGYTTCTFPIREPWPGYTVIVEVTAQCPEGEITTQTSYIPCF